MTNPAVDSTSLASMLNAERSRTAPDYVVYTPKSLDGSTHDTGNEHFLVFDGPDGSLMAVWTQSTFEGEPDQRLMFASSRDEGATWSVPRIVAGATPPAVGGMSSWGFPLVSRSGRIYVLYSKHIGVNDMGTHTTGLMAGIYSDDNGATWSPEQIMPMPRSKWDNPDPNIPANWIVWQRPDRLSEGKYLAGMTRWVSPPVRHAPPIDHWTALEAVVEFIRFENIDDDPEPADIDISWFAQDDDALRTGFPGHPEVSVLQEPSLVALPDGRIFASMRSRTGNPFYTVSADGGQTWRKPEVMRQSDSGPALLHPLSPCPIYTLAPGRYMFLYHNHDGHFQQWTPLDSHHHRRPIFAAIGTYEPDANQPISFSEPIFLMDNEGVVLGYGKGRADLAMYASLTVRDGNAVLWYPERKFFLLGKKIPAEWITGDR